MPSKKSGHLAETFESSGLFSKTKLETKSVSGHLSKLWPICLAGAEEIPAVTALLSALAVPFGPVQFLRNLSTVRKNQYQHERDTH